MKDRMKRILKVILFMLATLSLYGLMCDPAYEYNFYIENQTNNDLSAAFKIAENYYSPEGTFPDSVLIPSKTKKKILNDEGLGGAFALNDYFSEYIDSLTIYRNDTIIYRQWPTTDSLWISDSKIGNAGAGWRNYTFQISDSILTIQ